MPVTNRVVVAGLGAAFVAVSTVAPLVLKTTPSDLDLFFWPSAEAAVTGHPLLIYSAQAHGISYNDNGPLGLIPLLPAAALANALGWAGSLVGRAALTGAITSMVVLLLAFQAARYTGSAVGDSRRQRAVVAAVVLAPALWIAVLDYGHVEQPLELCLILLAATWALRERNALTGLALGAAVLIRTIAGFAAIPLVLAPLAARRIRPSAACVATTIITIGVGLAPFLLADESTTVHALFTYRGGLPIGGGSFWVIAKDASWAGLIGEGDVYLGAAVATALVAITLLRKPMLGTTRLGLMGLLTIASCCFPLLAKSVFPYYLAEPYVFASIWWLARPGRAISWRALVPLLLTVDVFIVKASLQAPFSTWGALGGVASSAVLAGAVTLVMFDLLRSPVAVDASQPLGRRLLHHELPAIQKAR